MLDCDGETVSGGAAARTKYVQVILAVQAREQPPRVGSVIFQYRHVAQIYRLNRVLPFTTSSFLFVLPFLAAVIFRIINHVALSE